MANVKKETEKLQNEVAQTSPPPVPEKAMTIKSLLDREDVKVKFKELLGKRSSAFMTSVLQIVASNDQLKSAEPMSVMQSAAVAATLDLPLNNNLGFAYIVPYNTKQKDGTWKVLAQFQVGAKGFKQLSMRTGQFVRLNDTDVREGEIKSFDRLSGDIEFEWIQDEEERRSKPVVGYASYFKLINGFEKTFYMTVGELREHAKSYSKTFQKGYGLWMDDFDGMARKTVTKLNLSKNAPLSVEIQMAVKLDQAIIKDVDTEDVEYIDNDSRLIEQTVNIEELRLLYDLKKESMSEEEIVNADRIIENEEVHSYSKLFKLLQSK